MKNQILYLIAGIILLLVSSCSVPKYYGVKADKYGISEIAYFPPVSLISLIEHGNQSRYNDSLTRISDSLQRNLIQQNKDEICLSAMLEIPSNSSKKNYKREVEAFFGKADKENDISNVDLPPIIDSMLVANNKRFGLLTMNIGFERTATNRAIQDAKAVGLAVLTLGTFTQIPISSNSILFAMVVDSKKNSVVSFRKNTEGDPCDANLLKRKFRKMFKDFFWK